MSKITKQSTEQKNVLYNNILLLTRNKIFYTKFDLIDTFQNRIYLIFIHISFIFIKIKRSNKKKIYKVFFQNIFDLIFHKIEENMREIGYGDSVINKNMRFLIKIFYSILLDCENYKEMNIESKSKFIIKHLKLNKTSNSSNYSDLIDYFDKYEAFCFDLSLDSVLKGELKFNYK